MSRALRSVRWVACWCVVAGALGNTARAAEAEAVAPGAAAEKLSAWRYFQELPLSPSGDAPWQDCMLTPSVFDGARADLADLRVYDAGGVEVPYALRVRRAENTTAAVDAREFNRTGGPDGTSQLSLDLGEAKIEHNEISITTPGANFRRHVVLEGSDDEAAWSKLSESDLLAFERDGRTFVEKTVAYPPSRFRFLRLTVSLDPQVDRQPVEIGEVVVRRRIEVPGELDMRPVELGPRQAERADGGPGSAWLIGLGGTGVPCDRLLVTIDDPEFARDYYLEAGGPTEDIYRGFWRVHSGVWRRRAGEERKELVAEFSEVPASRLRLVVTDNRNPPLQITGVRAAAPARVVVVARSNTLAGPLRVYYGNPKAEAPNYDFARNLPPQLDPAPVRLALQRRQDNPAYQPEPLPLTERLPWLIYALLGVAVTVLGALILSLAKNAISLVDARERLAA